MREAKKNESSGSGFVWDAAESSRLGDAGFPVRSDEAELKTIGQHNEPKKRKSGSSTEV
jgi:hypothetical protein